MLHVTYTCVSIDHMVEDTARTSGLLALHLYSLRQVSFSSFLLRLEVTDLYDLVILSPWLLALLSILHSCLNFSLFFLPTYFSIYPFTSFLNLKGT